jgi:hypothetical protein
MCVFNNMAVFRVTTFVFYNIHAQFVPVENRPFFFNDIPASFLQKKIFLGEMGPHADPQGGTPLCRRGDRERERGRGTVRMPIPPL